MNLLVELLGTQIRRFTFEGIALRLYGRCESNRKSLSMIDWDVKDLSKSHTQETPTCEGRVSLRNKLILRTAVDSPPFHFSPHNCFSLSQSQLLYSISPRPKIPCGGLR